MVKPASASETSQQRKAAVGSKEITDKEREPSNKNLVVIFHFFQPNMTHCNL
jgi:hypothetical protein